DKWLASDSANAVTAALRKAHCLRQMGEIDEARALLVGFADQVEGALALARLTTSQEGQTAAAAEWEKCVRLFPDHLEAHLGRTQHLLARDAYPDAEAALEDVIARWPQ